MYTITLVHPSIARARVITVDAHLAQAKRAATKEFGAEQQDYRIVIANVHGDLVASRRVGDRRWSV